MRAPDSAPPRHIGKPSGNAAYWRASMGIGNPWRFGGGL
jgi:hypothetical protein